MVIVKRGSTVSWETVGIICEIVSVLTTTLKTGCKKAYIAYFYIPLPMLLWSQCAFSRFVEKGAERESRLAWKRRKYYPAYLMTLCLSGHLWKCEKDNYGISACFRLTLHLRFGLFDLVRVSATGPVAGFWKSKSSEDARKRGRGGFTVRHKNRNHQLFGRPGNCQWRHARQWRRRRLASGIHSRREVTVSQAALARRGRCWPGSGARGGSARVQIVALGQNQDAQKRAQSVVPARPQTGRGWTQKGLRRRPEIDCVRRRRVSCAGRSALRLELGWQGNSCHWRHVELGGGGGRGDVCRVSN